MSFHDRAFPLLHSPKPSVCSVQLVRALLHCGMLAWFAASGNACGYMTLIRDGDLYSFRFK